MDKLMANARATNAGKLLVALTVAAMVLAACATDSDEVPVGADDPPEETDAGEQQDSEIADDPQPDEEPEQLEIEEVTLVLPFGFLIGFAPSLVAKSAGFFEERGLDVTIETAQGSSQAVQQVLGGQALISRTGGPDHISAVVSQGAPLLSVGTISQLSPFEVISSSDNPVTSPEDFRGGTVGIVSPGGATEFLLDIMLEVAGISQDEIQKEVVGNAPGAFALVEAGDIDAFIATSGTRSSLQFDDAEIEFFSTDEFAPLPGQVYVVAADDVDANAELIDRFLGGVNDALTFMLEEDEGWEGTLEFLSEWDIAALQDIERAKFELDVQSKDWSAEDGTVLLNRPDAWEEAQNLMVTGGIIEAPVDPDTLYTNRFVEQVIGNN